jgi:DDE family transposase
VASQFPGATLHASNYRRLQRFFQYVRLDGETVAPLTMRMLVPGRSAVLALDRTHWKLGGKDVNILVLALATRRFRVPLLWTVLDHPGNSSTDQRIALMDRYLALFGVSSIRMLLADREFIGAAWLDFAAKRLGTGEKLVIATNTGNPGAALNAYRKRWGIECLFADTKTRGFNIEDTHLTDPTKIATLLAVVTLACIWAYRSATATMGRRAPRQKTHGRKEKSWFRIGMDAMRRAIIHQPEKAIRAWEQNWPKRSLKTSLP